MLFKEIVDLIVKEKGKIIFIENYSGGKLRFNNIIDANKKNWLIWSETDFSDYVIQSYMEKKSLSDFIDRYYDFFVLTNLEFLTNKPTMLNELKSLIDYLINSEKTVILTYKGNITEEFELLLNSYSEDIIIKSELIPDMDFVVDLYVDKISKMLLTLNDLYCNPVDNIFDAFMNPHKGNEQIANKLEDLMHEFLLPLYFDMNTKKYLEALHYLYTTYKNIKDIYVDAQNLSDTIPTEIPMENEESEEIAAHIYQIINHLHQEKLTMIPESVKWIFEECYIPGKYPIDFTKPLQEQVTKKTGKILQECIYFYF